MGAYDGPEVCELIGIFMLSLLSKHINKNHIGLYRDDGLAILKNTSSPEAEKLKKKFQKLFKEKDLHMKTWKLEDWVAYEHLWTIYFSFRQRTM